MLIRTALALLFVTIAASAREPLDRPNVVVIYLDDSGYGDFSYNGNPIIETPVPKDLVGKKPAVDAAIFREAEVALVAVKRTERRFLGRLVPEQGEETKRKVVGFPDAGFMLATSDVLVLFGPEKKLRAFLEDHAGE